LCEPRDIGKERHIDGLDSKRLLRFGNVVQKDGNRFATIIGSIAVEQIHRRTDASNTLVKDLEDIFASNVGHTTAEALVAARIGQGNFRSKVLQLWENRCCVSGSVTLNAVRASHIKPWRHCTDRERLDPNNGLPLMATLDALFDVGLISFDAKGTCLVAAAVNQSERRVLGLINLALAKRPNRRMAAYLEYHRTKVFLDGKTN
jgi:predicted restriction endonuclease